MPGFNVRLRQFRAEYIEMYLEAQDEKQAGDQALEHVRSVSQEYHDSIVCPTAEVKDLQLVNTTKIHDDDPQEEELKAFVKQHRNELVIEGNSVAELLSFNADEDDYYFVVAYENGMVNAISCAVGVTLLKGHLPDNEYDRILGIWNLNKSRTADNGNNTD